MSAPRLASPAHPCTLKDIVTEHPLLPHIRAALHGVEDPEIRRPITDLGMVDDVAVSDDGAVQVRILLTVVGCPMRSEIITRVSTAVSAVAGVSTVAVELGVMSDEQREAMRTMLRGGEKQRVIPFAQPGNLTRVLAIASGKGGVGKSSVTVNLALALAAQGRSVGILDADIYGHSIPDLLGLGDARPTVVDDMILPVPALGGLKVISIGMLKPSRDQVVAWRGPILDRALTQLLADVYWGDLDYLLLDLPPGTGDVAMSLGQKIPGSEVHRGDDAPVRGLGDRGAGGHHGAHPGAAGHRRGGEHELDGDGVPALLRAAPAGAVRLGRRHPGGRGAHGAVRLRGAAAGADPVRRDAAQPAATRAARSSRPIRSIRPRRPWCPWPARSRRGSAACWERACPCPPDRRVS